MAALSSAAMTLTFRHHTGWWTWAVAAGGGLGVGVSKILAGEHFYSDVAVGFAAGTAVGILVPYLHRKTSKLGSFLLLPQVNVARLEFRKVF
jgi:membrane-associated phospholipid phosphatase